MKPGTIRWPRHPQAGLVCRLENVVSSIIMLSLQFGLSGKTYLLKCGCRISRTTRYVCHYRWPMSKCSKTKKNVRISVSIAPGAYALAVIPWGPNSVAAVCIIPRIANLDALYAAPLAVAGIVSHSNKEQYEFDLFYRHRTMQQ